MSSLPPSSPAADEDAYRAALRTTGVFTPGCAEDVIASLTFDGTTSLCCVSRRGPRPLDTFDEAPTKKQDVTVLPMRLAHRCRSDGSCTYRGSNSLRPSCNDTGFVLRPHPQF
jgi:hypothetical protein